MSTKAPTLLYIFDVDGTLVENFGIRPLPDVQEVLTRLKDEGHHLAVATNQSGPAWGLETGDSKYPEAAALGRRFWEIARLLPLLQEVPWFVAVGDPRLSLDVEPYDQIVQDLAEGAGPLEIYVSADWDWRKPGPGMLLAACRYYRVPPAQAIFVGDFETDAEAADAAGMGFAFADDFFGW
ncbi:MAG: HAD-IIIA family hydrolase [Anaerolineae bacterium]